ncbi:MAG: rRNA maturation RNase YbeY [Planctomycetes bacterium]|nr:rRNA maturation RNase YbeY [Planctomycetota bacterium]
MRVPRSLLRKAASRAMRLGRLAGPLEIQIVGAREMACLNERHLGHQGPTDVLAFPLGTDGPWDEGPRGVVAICADVARREAARRKTSASGELALYAVHGVLHLAGYRDKKPRDAERMDRAQRRILADLGVRAIPMRETT